MKEIAVLTGTRAEYGLLKPIMEEIQESNSLKLSVIVTGMHLSPRHGSTINEIKNDGFDTTHTVNMLLDTDSHIGMAKSTGIAISGLAQKIESIDPDYLLVLGDRIEAFAGAVSAAMMNIPVGHIAGGSIRGGGMIDESIRHAITRFAHLHFVQTEQNARILRDVGEDSDRIYTVGAPALDVIANGDFAEGEEISSSLGVDTQERIIVVIQHPVTTEAGKAGVQMQETLRAIEDVNSQIVIIHPNSDPGREKIVDEIKDFSEKHEQVVGIPNLERKKYLGLLNVADVLVGNSSSGILEAPCFGTPVINVGTRQGSRPKPKLVHSVPHDRKEIKKKVQRILIEDQSQSIDCNRSPYYHGGAGEKIVDVLKSFEAEENLLNKILHTDLNSTDQG